MNKIKVINRDDGTQQKGGKLKNAFDLYSKLKYTIYEAMDHESNRQILDHLVNLYKNFAEYREHRDIAYLENVMESSKKLTLFYSNDGKYKNNEMTRLFASITINAQEFIVDSIKYKNPYKSILLLRQMRDIAEKFGIEPFMYDVKERIKQNLLALEFKRD